MSSNKKPIVSSNSTLALAKVRSNGRKRNRRTALSNIANAVGATPVVRNMMPRSSTFNRKIDFPLFLYLKTNRKIAICSEVTGGTEYDMPFGGLEFTNCQEYQALFHEVDTIRLISLGASVNFVQNETITIVNLYEKWMYGADPQSQLCQVDSTYQPLEWDNKMRQNYKTYIPDQTAGYKTYYSWSAFQEILRQINYQIFGDVPQAPAQNTLIGTINLAMFVQCKRKQVPFYESALTQIQEMKNENDDKEKKLAEANKTIIQLKDTIDKILNK